MAYKFRKGMKVWLKKFNNGEETIPRERVELLLVNYKKNYAMAELVDLDKEYKTGVEGKDSVDGLMEITLDQIELPKGRKRGKSKISIRRPTNSPIS